jgi:hypothetical protein
MITATITIQGKEFTKITASEGFAFRRIHDGFMMGSDIVLGLDFSTGTQRLDLPEYYEEVLLTQQEAAVETKLAELEETQNDIINVLNERGLL